MRMKKTTSLAQKFAILTILKGKTQAELARDIGMKPSNLNHYLRGHSDIHAKHFTNILLALDIDIEALVNQEIATLNGLKLEAREGKLRLGEAVESVAKALPATERKAMLRYVMKLAQLNLGVRAKSQVQAMKGWAK